MLLLRLHDALTRAGFIVGAAALLGIFALYNFEVATRYFLNAPTRWSSDTVSYLLCAMVALVVPQLSRSDSHIAITFVSEGLGPAARRGLGIVLALVSGVVCLAAGWMVGNVTLDLYAKGIQTIGTFLIPKWWLGALLTYGFVSSGLMFLRRAGGALLARAEDAA